MLSHYNNSFETILCNICSLFGHLSMDVFLVVALYCKMKKTAALELLALNRFVFLYI